MKKGTPLEVPINVDFIVPFIVPLIVPLKQNYSFTKYPPVLLDPLYSISSDNCLIDFLKISRVISVSVTFNNSKSCVLLNPGFCLIIL